MTDEEHRQRHIALHKAFDELLADFLTHQSRKTLLSDTTVMDLMIWSYSQTQHPTKEGT